MAMRFIYGNFQGQPRDNWQYAGGHRVAVRKNGQLTSVLATVAYKFTITPDPNDSLSPQLQLGRRLQQIKDGIKFDGYDVGFLHDDGTPSGLYLRTNQAQSGVRITRYPFADVEIPGVDYATSLSGSCAFEAEYAAEQIGGGGGLAGNVLVAYSERLSVQGNGGPRKVLQEYLSGSPEWFTLADQTIVRANQSGKAVLEGYDPGGFAFEQQPYFPDLLDNETEGHSPVIEMLENGRWQCSVEWNYNFSSPGPLTGEQPIPPGAPRR